jgi:hypothetical protein
MINPNIKELSNNIKNVKNHNFKKVTINLELNNKINTMNNYKWLTSYEIFPYKYEEEEEPLQNKH